METAFILAAGLGTRLKPWTEKHPKALVPVEGVPMLERVIRKLVGQGFRRIIVNVHHFSDQIIDFLKDKDFGAEILISDESGELLDTGGGLVKVSGMLEGWDGNLLVHNVDILSNQDFGALMETHRASGNDITLLTSGRDSTRKLIFGKDGELKGWHDRVKEKYRPEAYSPASEDREEAFSGIYIVGAKARRVLSSWAESRGRAFPIMDFLLSLPEALRIKGFSNQGLRLLDIGKPETLARASDYLSR